VITPPDFFAQLDDEFHFDPFDPYPYPRPPNFNSLTIEEWPGKTIYCNMPFLAIDDADGHGPTAHVRKQIEQHRKFDKTMVGAMPTRSYEIALLAAGAEMRSAGRIKWLNEKGEASPSPPPIITYILRGSHHREVPVNPTEFDPELWELTQRQMAQAKVLREIWKKMAGGELDDGDMYLLGCMAEPVLWRARHPESPLPA